MLADISAPKTTSISDEVNGITREEEILLAAPSDGEITDVNGGESNPDKGRATRVMTSFEPEGTKTAGRRVTVIATPVSDTTCLDKVICKKCEEHRNEKS